MQLGGGRSSERASSQLASTEFRIKVIGMMRAIIFFAGAMISGCALLDPRPPEEVVLERAEAHLAALRSGQFRLALEYTTPAFQESARARRYGAMYAAAPAWLDAEIYAVECEEAERPERCTVRTRVQPFIAPHIQANVANLPVSVSHEWILTGGDWYRYES